MGTFRANEVEDRLAKLAANQRGVASLAQLRALGLADTAVRHRAARGRLHRVHRGVYAVGHDGLSPEGLWMAAVLALGGGAVLSHRAAAALWELLPWARGAVDVTVPGDGGKKPRMGIRLHRSLTLLPSPGVRSQTTLRKIIPVTTPSRTLADRRRCVSPQQLARAYRQAEVLGLPVEDSVPPAERTHTELERRFLRLCRRHRLPLPEPNAPVGPYLADFLWRDARLIVETDSWRFHRGRANFEHDRQRGASLAAAGYEVMRFSWRQVEDEPDAVADAIRARLAARATASRRASARPA